MNNMAHGIAAGILIGTGVFTVAADQAAVTPPQTSALLLELFADGVQIYTCEAKESRFQWSFKAPEANLFDKQGRQIGTHFGGPTWKLDDGSAVVGDVIAKADAPEPDAILGCCSAPRAGRGRVTCRPSLYPPDGDQAGSSAEC